jgi:UDP-N-acetylmuramoyl-L-alanyl-D-glutamate--2,6-diaminopimelate ligase
VAEISSQGLDRGRAEGLHFSQCLFTNLSGEHLDYHGDMETYFQAKTRLFTNRPAGVPGIVNLDDEYGRRMAAEHPDISGVSLEREAFLRGTIKEVRTQSTILELTGEGRSETISINRPGRHNALNFLMAAAAALKAGIEFDRIVSAAGQLPVVPGRLEPVDCGQDFQVYVDYAHTDNALQNVLAALRPVTPGRIITVFGAGGDRDRSKRPRMGRAACEGSDLVIVTSDNPRTEEPQAIINDILKGTDGRQWQTEPDRGNAIRLALREAAADDTVLIAGKGHEDYQIIGTEKHHFSDAEVVHECLCGKAVS